MRQVVDLGLQLDGLVVIEQQGDRYAQDNSNECADESDHQPLRHEDGHDVSAGSSERHEDADVTLLVLDHEDQRRNDVQRRHRHDQADRDEQRQLLEFERGEVGAILALPVHEEVVGAQSVTEFLHDRSGV